MQTIKPKKTLTEETYEVLLDAICSGELPPGERITQDEIAARLNVSRQPVNSALSLLKSNRLVEDTGRRGVVVAPIDPGLFGAIYEYRRAVEPYAVRLAAERRGCAARLEADEVMTAGHAALASGKTTELVVADMRFHEMLYRWSGNAVIASSMRLNWHHIRRTMTAILQVPGTPEASWDDHAQIVDAFFRGEVDMAADAMTCHITKAEEKIGRALQNISAETHEATTRARKA